MGRRRREDKTIVTGLRDREEGEGLLQPPGYPIHRPGTGLCNETTICGGGDPKPSLRAARKTAPSRMRKLGPRQRSTVQRSATESMEKLGRTREWEESYPDRRQLRGRGWRLPDPSGVALDVPNWEPNAPTMGASRAFSSFLESLG
ncbi:hypothetical protein CRG98_017562 [Punica granatum]|uniref:Uncharacterized protein n=1 Tax=Punica granatum TaxID=22663 RepID=A0A2I0K0V1_PUNGR|nr:hypothetical protein CRG98_017562 [Punica granatum]